MQVPVYSTIAIPAPYIAYHHTLCQYRRIAPYTMPVPASKRCHPPLSLLRADPGVAPYAGSVLVIV
eukprot:2507672-Rhodomonas_salina.4